ncbi:MAG TPA: MFS transporter [Longimicrobium sp.]|nr:MFS transporter [Longimicrobium sp.]
MKLPKVLSPGMRTFTAVWFGQMVSMIGTALTDFGVGVWIYQKTGSATPFAMVLLCMVVPGILATPVAGALADRWDRRRTMVLADAGAALSTLFMAVMLMGGRLELWHILAAVTVASTCRAFQGPAWMASTTQLVPAEQLGRASGMMNFGRAVSGIVGPMLGGALVPTIGLQRVMLIDFATFVVAVGILFLVRFPATPRSTAPAGEKPGILREASAGWRYVGSQPALRAHLLFFGLVNLALGYVWVLHAPLVLGFAGPGSLGAVGSAMGFGMLAGSLVMTISGGPKEKKAAAILGYGVLLGLCLMLMGARPSVPLVAVAIFGITLGIPVVNGSLMALWMPRIPAELRGRTYAVIQMLVWSTEPIAYVTAGVLADRFFKPLLVEGGPLAGSLGGLVGVGPTRGIGVLLGVVGVFVLGVTVAMALVPAFRTADSIPLAATPEAPAAEKAPAEEAAGEPVPVPA